MPQKRVPQPCRRARDRRSADEVVQRVDDDEQRHEQSGG
jgi:hypothetical protein